MSGNVILNVAVGRWFKIGQARLRESISTTREPADLLAWSECYPPGSEPHEKTPYGFKVAAFRDAMKRGYDRALWLDASCWLIRPLDAVWRHIEEHGYLLVEDGNRVGQWSTDAALGIMGITRDDAMDCLIPVGACIGLDFGSTDARRFLDEWEWYAEHGAFFGPWNNDGNRASTDPRCRGHRHDIAVAGVIIHRNKLRMLKPPTYYATWSDHPTQDVCVVAQGM